MLTLGGIQSNYIGERELQVELDSILPSSSWLSMTMGCSGSSSEENMMGEQA